MPLFIGEERVTNVPISVPELFNFASGDSLKEAGDKLLESPIEHIGPKDLLYVLQREFAVLAPDDESVHILGTEDATTCHIGIIRHSGSGVTALAHFDGSDLENGLTGMITTVQEMSAEKMNGRLELHLAGGFLDTKNTSVELSKSLIRLCMNATEDIYLMTACITDFNTTVKKGLNFPIIYGIGVNVKNGKIFRGTFHEKGPQLALRSAAHFTGAKMLNMYDNESHNLLIGPYDWKPQRWAASWHDAPDQEILSNLSTSPKQEPPDFVDNVRASLKFLTDHPHPKKELFPNGKSLRYEISKEGVWTLVKKASSK